MFLTFAYVSPHFLPFWIMVKQKHIRQYHNSRYNLEFTVIETLGVGIVKTSDNIEPL